MADPVKATCSWNPLYQVDVTVEGRTVTFEHQARGDHGLMGAPYRVRDTFDLNNPQTYRQQRLLAGVEIGEPRTIGVSRSEPWRINYNRCANELSRAQNPLWRPVRDVAKLF